MDDLRVYFSLLVIAFSSARLFTDTKNTHTLFVVICAAVSLSSLYGVIQYMGMDPFPWATRQVEEYRGLPSTYGNPNFAGHTLILALILGTGLAVNRNFRWAFILLALPLFHLYQTHMRCGPVALLGAAILTGIAVVIHRRLRLSPGRKIMLALIATGIVGMAGILTLLPVSRIFTGYFFPTDGSLILRYNGYYGAACMALDNPIFGVGPGNYSRENIPYWTPFEKRWFADEQKRNTHVHCDPLETAVETGVPGMAVHLLLACLLLVKSMGLAFKSRDPDKKRLGFILSAFFFSFFIDGLFGFNLRVPVSAGLFFLVAGLLDGLYRGSSQSLLKTPEKTEKPQREKHPPQFGKEEPGPAFSSIGLCIISFLCLIWTCMVFWAELNYQKANGARLFAEKSDSPLQSEQALKDGESDILKVHKFVFWDSRYTDLLGHIAMKRGATDSAIRYYLDSLNNDPYHPHTAANLARAYLSHALRFVRDNQQADIDSTAQFLSNARSTAELAQKYCPESPYVQDVTWRIERASAILEEERGGDASAAWALTENLLISHLKQSPLDVPASYRALVMAHEKTGKKEAALPILERLAESGEENEELWSSFKRISDDVGEYDQFLDALTKAFAESNKRLPESEENLVDITRYLSYVYDHGKKQANAVVPFIRSAIGSLPNRLELWSLYAGTSGDLYFETLCNDPLKDNSAAIPDIIRQLCLDSADGINLAAASNALARESMLASGKPQAVDYTHLAMIILQRLERLSLPPSRQAEIRANIATTFIEGGKWFEAEQNFDYAIANVAESSRARLMAARARALEKLGRLPEALQLAENAIRLLPKDAMVLLTCGRLMGASGRWSEAADYLQQAVNTLPEGSAAKKQALLELQSVKMRLHADQTKG